MRFITVVMAAYCMSNVFSSGAAIASSKTVCKLTVETTAHLGSPAVKQVDEIAKPNVEGAPLLYSSSKTNATASIKVNEDDRKVYASIFRVLGFSTESGWVDLDYGFHNTEWSTIVLYYDPQTDLNYKVSCKR